MRSGAFAFKSRGAGDHGDSENPFSEAKELVSRVYKRAFSEKLDFEPEEEKLLCEYVKKTTGSDFVFVTHYPSAKRPFYAMDSRENPAVTEVLTFSSAALK